MEYILSNYDDKDEASRQIEELSQANHELMEQNETLKQMLEEEQNAGTSSGTSPSSTTITL